MHRELYKKDDFMVRTLLPADYPDWKRLYHAYADFYKVSIEDKTFGTVWAWLHDPGHNLQGIALIHSGPGMIGLAHLAPIDRPLSGETVGYLHDLFVDPAYRGTGAADAIFAGLKVHAKDQEWSQTRWLTQHFNERARKFYDRYTGGPSDFIMYSWKTDQ